MNFGVGEDYFSMPGATTPGLSVLQSEMNRFDELRRSDPARCKRIFENGAELVVACQQGQLSKIRRLLAQTAKEDMLIYFSVKMLKEALANGHLVIADQMIKSGFPFKNYNIPNVLLDVLRDNVTTDDNAERVVRFLHEREFDLNSQDRHSWETPVHFAVRRGFVVTLTLLIKLGCDVNAVAKDDLQPLHLADRLAEYIKARADIVELLTKSGARRTWRRSSDSSSMNNSSSACSSSSTSSFSSASSSLQFSTFDGATTTESTMVSANGSGTGKFVTFRSSQIVATTDAAPPPPLVLESTAQPKVTFMKFNSSQLLGMPMVPPTESNVAVAVEAHAPSTTANAPTSRTSTSVGMEPLSEGVESLSIEEQDANGSDGNVAGVVSVTGSNFAVSSDGGLLFSTGM